MMPVPTQPEGLAKWDLWEMVTAEAREDIAINLDEFYIARLCRDVRAKGYEPVEGARTTWDWIAPEEMYPRGVWRMHASVFAVPSVLYPEKENQ